MKAIYKITNKKNGKIYVGQSKNPEKRFIQHKRDRDSKLLFKAIKEFGFENFELEIIEWTKNYNDREKYWIKTLNCIAPNGYNISEGGNTPPVFLGEENKNHKITKDIANGIKKDLIDNILSFSEIALKYNTTKDIIRHINKGDTWRNNDEIEKYPLRPYKRELNESKINEVIFLLKNSTLTRREIGEKVGWCRTQITGINNGKRYYNPTFNYPIRTHNAVTTIPQKGSR